MKIKIHPCEQKYCDCFTSNAYILCPQSSSIFLYLSSCEISKNDQRQVTIIRKEKNLKIYLEFYSCKVTVKYAYRYHEYITQNRFHAKHGLQKESENFRFLMYRVSKTWKIFGKNEGIYEEVCIFARMQVQMYCYTFQDMTPLPVIASSQDEIQ